MGEIGMQITAPKLDPREEHFRIPSHHDALSLFARYLPPAKDSGEEQPVVLYVHGGTFSSALSIAYRFDGRSWRDELADAGMRVWAFDFHGFGPFSDPYPEMRQAPEAMPPLGRAEDASRQIEAVVRFVCKREGIAKLSIIAHSWGTIASGLFAGRCPELVERMAFFGPIAQRPRIADAVRLPGWRLISLQDQWQRFTETVPDGERPVLLRRHFDEWGEAYLDSDAESRARAPMAVKVPSGAFQDIFDAWAGELAYDPALIRAPVAILRGEWDGVCSDTDARWLFNALSQSPLRLDVKIGRATHLMHLEAARYALYRATEAFLRGHDIAPDAR
jgi:pimeloyl-ACP methyl ester carboxylesterase